MNSTANRSFASYRITCVSVFALLLIVASSSIAVAQSVTIPGLAGAGASFTIPEPVTGAAEAPLSISIVGATFPAPLQIVMFDDTANQQVSDLIIFDNSVGNQATITFISDNEQSTLTPLPGIKTILAPEGTPVVEVLPLFDLTALLTLPLTATMFSDLDIVPPNTNFSDAINIRVPEPSAIYLAGFALAALAGLAYRRRAAKLARSQQ
jgi:hypothetical protein